VLEQECADHRSHFRITQFLVKRLGHGSDPSRDIADFPLSKTIEQGGQANSHRGFCHS
jgi:hypothetical protein